MDGGSGRGDGVCGCADAVADSVADIVADSVADIIADAVADCIANTVAECVADDVANAGVRPGPLCGRGYGRTAVV